MSILGMYRITAKLSDLSEMVTSNSTISISELRKRMEILVIDDQDFFHEECLRKNGFRITCTLLGGIHTI